MVGFHGAKKYDILSSSSCCASKWRLGTFGGNRVTTRMQLPGQALIAVFVHYPLLSSLDGIDEICGYVAASANSLVQL